MQVVPYLNFNGNCREAFETYQKVLGGEIVAMISHEDWPMEGMPDEAWKGKILHANLNVNGYSIMASDVPSEHYRPPQSISVSLHFDSPAETERAFAELSEGGSIDMPLGEQPWAYRFGAFTDRFGIPWMLNCEHPE